MTTFETGSSRNRDAQDNFERGLWGTQSYDPAYGATMKVRGTGGTTDDDVPVLNTGYSFNMKTNSDNEVMMVSLNGDTNQKYAFLTLPRDKQRQWKEGTGGVQSPTDKAKYIEFNEKRMHLVDGNYAFGTGGNLEIKNGKVLIRGDVTIQGTLTVNTKVVTPLVVPGLEVIPPFEA